MKSLFKYISLFITLLFYLQLNAQEENGSHAKQNLSGKWKAFCGTEFVNKAEIKSCELCPFVIDPNDPSKVEIKDIVLIFQNETFILTRNGESTTVPYSIKEDTYLLSFNFNQKDYLFRIFYTDKYIILEDAEGLVLLLDKIK